MLQEKIKKLSTFTLLVLILVSHLCFADNHEAGSIVSEPEYEGMKFENTPNLNDENDRSPNDGSSISADSSEGNAAAWGIGLIILAMFVYKDGKKDKRFKTGYKDNEDPDNSTRNGVAGLMFIAGIICFFV